MRPTRIQQEKKLTCYPAIVLAKRQALAFVVAVYIVLQIREPGMQSEAAFATMKH